MGARLSMTSYLMALHKRVRREQGARRDHRPAGVSSSVDARDGPLFSPADPTAPDGR